MSLPPVEWSPADFAYRTRAEECLAGVVRRLGLSARVRRWRVRVLPRPAGDAAHVAWIEGARSDVRLVTDLGNFLTPDGRRALAHLPADVPPPLRRFSKRATRALFLHELSHVRDGLAFGIDSSRLPRGRWAPFNEAWNVWIDGRLWRRGTPALRPAERWHEFRATFPGARRRGRAGAQSRAVFDRLWRADVLTQRDLLDAVDALVG